MIGVIGLLGAKGVGKDTLAGLLAERLGFRCTSFAAALYEEVSDAYGVCVEFLRGRETKESPVPELRLANCRDERFVRLALPLAGLPIEDRASLRESLAKATHCLGWCVPDLYLSDPWCIQEGQEDPSSGVGHWLNSGFWRATGVTAAAKDAESALMGAKWPLWLVDSLRNLAGHFAELAAAQPGSTVDVETISYVPGYQTHTTRICVQVPGACLGDCDEAWESRFTAVTRSLAAWIRQVWRHAALEAPRSPRWTLQLWGTEYRRRGVYGRDSYWIDLVASRIQRESGARFVVTDVRTYGEARYIEDIGGVLVRIRRPELEARESAAREKGVLTALHDSETELLGYPVRLEILNREGEPQNVLEELSPLLPELAEVT